MQKPFSPHSVSRVAAALNPETSSAAGQKSRGIYVMRAAKRKAVVQRHPAIGNINTADSYR
jgi:hypothetical protein